MRNMWKNLMTIVAVLGLLACGAVGQPVDETFTYQGKLLEGGGEANGNYNIRVTLEDQAGVLVAGPEEMLSVPVMDGLFSIDLNFGAALYSADRRYLKIEVFEAGVGYVEMNPRTPINATPLAAVAMRSLDNEWDRNGVILSAGDTDERVLVNPDLSAGLLHNSNGIFQVNFDRATYGGMWMNSENSGGIPFYGFSMDNSLLGWIEVNPTTNQMNLWNGNAFAPSLSVEATKATVPNDLVVGEDVQVAGEIVKEFGNDEHYRIGPVAYGSFIWDGTKISGTANISAVWNATDAEYEVTVAGENIVTGEYTSVVTAASNFGTFGTVGSNSGQLRVRMFRFNGNRTQADFQVVIYKNDKLFVD